MKDTPYHTVATAPDSAKPLLEDAKIKYGMVPNLFAKMAETPMLLQAYMQIAELFSKTSLTPTEQQIVLLTTSRINGCEYCVGVHSVLADMGGVSVEITNAIRDDLSIPDSKLEALRQFTAKMVTERGWVQESDVDAFLNAGYSRTSVLEVVLGIGQKTLSNYTNHLVGTELDAAFSGRAWQAPS